KFFENVGKSSVSLSKDKTETHSNKENEEFLLQNSKKDMEKVD
ncbi:18601_t:CDS:1, partial [Gigaspora margarita]